MTEPELPPGFERIEHHDQLDVHHPGLGVVITVIERNDTHQQMHGSYPFKVTGARDQETFYEGAFERVKEAEEKVVELAHRVS